MSFEAVRRLKDSGEGELQVHGSCALIHTLQEAGLVDEYRVIIFPVTVGAGKRLFSDAAPPSGYTVSNSRTTAAGALYAEFVPDALRRRDLRSGGRSRGRDRAW